MGEIDCFFYKIKPSPQDAELVAYWSEAHSLAIKIRDSYDRAEERKLTFLCAQ